MPDKIQYNPNQSLVSNLPKKKDMLGRIATSAFFYSSAAFSIHLPIYLYLFFRVLLGYNSVEVLYSSLHFMVFFALVPYICYKYSSKCQHMVRKRLLLEKDINFYEMGFGGAFIFPKICILLIFFTPSMFMASITSNYLVSNNYINFDSFLILLILILFITARIIDLTYERFALERIKNRI